MDNSLRKMVEFGLAAGTVLWVLSMGLSYMDDQLLFWYWRGISEMIWIGIGIWFTRVFYDQIMKWDWFVLVSKFLQANFVMVIFWWMWLVLMVTVIGTNPITIESLTGIPLGTTPAVDSWTAMWQMFWQGLVEASRLMTVGLLPVVGFKLYKAHVTKK